MRKVDLALIVGLLVVAGGMAWQYLAVNRLTIQVIQTQAESAKARAMAKEAGAVVNLGGATTRIGGTPAQLDLVMQLSRHSDRQVRQGAVLILGRLGAFQLSSEEQRRVRDQLMATLRIETDYTVLRSLLTAMEDLDRDGYGEILLKVSATGSPAARRTASSLLASKATPGMGPSIVQLLSSLTGSDSTSLTVRQNLLRALQRAPYSGAVTQLLSMLKRNDSSSSRSRVLAALSACATIEHGPLLLSALNELTPSGSTGSTYGVTYIISALGRLGDIRATSSLLPLLDATSTSVRVATIRTLGQLADPLAASALVKAFAQARASSSERRALERLFSRGYPGVKYQRRILELGLSGHPADPPDPTLVSSRELAKLMKQRAARLKLLVLKPEQE